MNLLTVIPVRSERPESCRFIRTGDDGVLHTEKAKKPPLPAEYERKP